MKFTRNELIEIESCLIYCDEKGNDDIPNTFTVYKLIDKIKKHLAK